MANPTTNYGFVLPTPTDLVTDLPADFEVALQGVDTQMKTNADAAIAKTIVDAKGDLIVGTGSDTVSRLGVGTNGQALVANSATATGLEWALPASGGMTLLSTTTLSGATVTISSINQAYTNLQIFIFGVTNATNNDQFRVAPNASTNICSQWGTGSGSSVGSQVDDYLYLTSGNFFPLRTSANNSWSLTINNYASTTARKPFSISGGCLNDQSFQNGFNFAGIIGTNSAITSLVFSNAGGNLSTGTVLIYGVK